MSIKEKTAMEARRRKTRPVLEQPLERERGPTNKRGTAFHHLKEGSQAIGARKKEGGTTTKTSRQVPKKKKENTNTRERGRGVPHQVYRGRGSDRRCALRLVEDEESGAPELEKSTCTKMGCSGDRVLSERGKPLGKA